MKRVLVVVDASNLYYSVKARFNGGKVNYEALYQEASRFGEVYRAIAYGAAIGNEADKFKTVLRKCGFEPKYKEPKVYPGITPDREFRKADWDVGMAMDIVKCADSVDVVVLCTGDGDLAPCLDWLESRGKICVVIGCGISRDLRSSCHEWVEITERHLDLYSPTRDLDVRPIVSGDATGTSAE